MGKRFTPKLAWMLVAALFTITKIGSNQDAVQWLDGYLHRGASRTWGVTSALKMSKSPSHEETWRALKYILISGRSQSEKKLHTVRF